MSDIILGMNFCTACGWSSLQNNIINNNNYYLLCMYMHVICTVAISLMMCMHGWLTSRRWWRRRWGSPSGPLRAGLRSWDESSEREGCPQHEGGSYTPSGRRRSGERGEEEQSNTSSDWENHSVCSHQDTGEGREGGREEGRDYMYICVILYYSGVLYVGHCPTKINDGALCRTLSHKN